VCLGSVVNGDNSVEIERIAVGSKTYSANQKKYLKVN
jgi:hypothetical protein